VVLELHGTQRNHQTEKDKSGDQSARDDLTASI
jgi:hypothetical protein